MQMDAQTIRNIIEESGLAHAELCFEEALSQLGSDDKGVIEAKVELKKGN